MKQILLFCLVLSFAITTTAQYADTTSHTLATEYLKNAKTQKTAGWLLLGGGALMATIGTAVLTKETEDLFVNIFDHNPPPAKNDETLGSVLTIGGLLAMAGSILFFIAACKNRRKAAAAISFKIGKTAIINSWTASVSRYPVGNIRLHL